MEATPNRGVDGGFGLIEVVVAMFLLASLAMALLPMMVQSIKQSAGNVSVASATRLADKQVDRAQVVGSKCSLVSGLVGSSTSVDSRGVTLTATTTAAGQASPSIPCPTATTAYPTTVKISIGVVRSDTGGTAATATTLVYVDAP